MIFHQQICANCAWTATIPGWIALAGGSLEVLLCMTMCYIQQYEGGGVQPRQAWYPRSWSVLDVQKFGSKFKGQICKLRFCIEKYLSVPLGTQKDKKID